jgi:methionyl-tRNA formyltransferase
MNKTVIFFGTPKIASLCLQSILDSNVTVLAVVTKIDKPTGRKHEIVFNEVKQLAIKNNIRVFQPNKLSEIYNELNQLKPDLILTCAYGKILSSDILSIPQFGCVNVHASLLPRWRGASPIQHAILNNDKQTGISLMYMVKELDAGDIIIQKPIQIDPKETYTSLYNKLSNLSYELLKQNIDSLFSKNIKTIKQNIKEVTYAKILNYQDEHIS